MHPTGIAGTKMAEKQCTKCHEVKSVDSFYWKHEPGTAPRRYAHCKSCHSKFAVIWAGKNKEKVSIKNREQRNKDIEKSRARDVSRNVSLPGKFSQLKYRAKKRGFPLEISFEYYAKLMEQLCYYCESPLNLNGYSLDRVDTCKGYYPENLVPCCGLCNWIKSDIFEVDEMQIIGQAIRIVKQKRYQRIVSNFEKVGDVSRLL